MTQSILPPIKTYYRVDRKKLAQAIRDTAQNAGVSLHAICSDIGVPWCSIIYPSPTFRKDRFLRICQVIECNPSDYSDLVEGNRYGKIYIRGAVTTTRKSNTHNTTPAAPAPPPKVVQQNQNPCRRCHCPYTPWHEYIRICKKCYQHITRWN